MIEKSFKDLMAEAKFFEGYSRWNDETDKYETWDESVSRVMSMHRDYYRNVLTDELEQLIYFAEIAYKNKEILGAQRALQFGGSQLLKHHARLYNCSGSYADRPEFFGEAFYLLLCGAGVGFSVQTQHIAKMPAIKPRTKEGKTFLIKDSIEGWAESLDVLLSSFFDDGGVHQEYEGQQVYFDFSEIRSKGSFISGGFKAPGPEPLQKALAAIELLIKKQLKAGFYNLRSIDIYDIVMHAADAVISGGVRRAATICLFSKHDTDMMKAKTGNWFNDNPQRARSNNTVVLNRGSITHRELREVIEHIKEFGEPGFCFTDDEDIVFNPCVTADTSVMTSEGARQVKDLVGSQFKAVVDGKEYSTGTKGFWSTGVKEVFKITLDNGMDLKLTDNHKLLTREGWKPLSDITFKDEVKVHEHTTGYSWGLNDTSEDEKGWLLGSLVGDGTISEGRALLRYWGEEKSLLSTVIERLTRNFKTYQNFSGCEDSQDRVTVSIGRFAEEFGIVRGNKAPNHSLEEQSSSFYTGYLRGFFDADGSPQGSQSKGVSVRLVQTSLESLQQVQRMLLRLGIHSKVYKNRKAAGYYEMPDGKGGSKEYYCKTTHELVISKANLVRYSEIIGFDTPHKKARLDSIISAYKRAPNKEKFYSKVVSIESLGEEEVYDVEVSDVHRFDANGMVAHNCFEVSMYPQTEDGESGWQLCNLSEVNGGKSKDRQTFLRQCQAAAIMGTLQAGYTDFRFLNEESHRIIETEALIGVGIIGWMENPDLLFDEETMRQGAEVVKATNRLVADLIGINPAARTTVVKPGGNAGVILATESGIKTVHAKKYIRNVQFNKETEIAKIFKKHNPSMVEESVWSQNNTDYCVAFPVVSPEGSIYTKDLTGVEQLRYVKKAQNNWIEHGTNVELCSKPYLRHNVSNTITVDDWDEVIDYVYDNRDCFCGVSFMPQTGDKAMPQSPYTEVLDMEEIISKYGIEAMFTSALIEAGLLAFNNDLWEACKAGIGKVIIDEDSPNKLLKNDFVRRFTKFSTKFKDVEDCVECLKNVYMLHKWWKIQNNAKFINFHELLEEKKFIDADTMGAQACSGGACELNW